MRMRKKPNLDTRMQRSAAALIDAPERLRGRWLESHPGHSKLAVELGCGKGRFTVDTAASEPDLFIAAVERVPEAIVVGMERALNRGVSNLGFIDMDVVNLHRVFAPGEADRIYINFCDPWPSNGRAHRRLTAPDFLTLYRTLLKPGGELRFKTDNVPLFDWSVEQLERCGWQLELVTHDLHKGGVCEVMTDYEAKFHAQGMPICKCVARRPDAEELPVFAEEQWPTKALRLPEMTALNAVGCGALLTQLQTAVDEGRVVNVGHMDEEGKPVEDSAYSALLIEDRDEEWVQRAIAAGAETMTLPGARYAVFELPLEHVTEKWDELTQAILSRGYTVEMHKPWLRRAVPGGFDTGVCEVCIPVNNNI